MLIELTHPFLYKAHDLTSLLDQCNKLSTFCNRLEKQSTLYPDRYDPEKYKGDGFELFVEALIKLSPMDNRIGIGNYQVVIENDNGIDGTGISVLNEKAAVQVKYRSNANVKLDRKEDNLSSFLDEAYLTDVLAKRENLLIITTASGLHHHTEARKFRGKVRCLGYDQLRQMVDNNYLFWNYFRKLVEINLT